MGREDWHVGPKIPFRWIQVLSGIAIVCRTTVGLAGPWADPGDIRLRQDVQMLNDSGVINIPTTTWPLSFPDISARLMSIDSSTLDPELQVVANRVKSRVKQEMRHGFSKIGLRVAGSYNPVQLRSFEYTPRAEGEAEAQVAWLGDYVAARLNITGVANPQDDQSLRFDGSFVTAALGNWNLSFGQQPRWWGPGWEQSLILSTNARPVPALSLDRNYSTPFESPWLNWIGPWKLNAFIGQLEKFSAAEQGGLRFISNAKLFGMRLSFKPVPKFEGALVRTAQWGGDGRPKSFSSFGSLLAGNDNQGQSAGEPGNQLAGFDVRWRSPLIGDFPYAVYTQFIGEDEAGGLPSKYFGQAGLELWGTSQVLPGNWRAHFEWANTLAQFYKNDPGFNVTYNHGIYQQGYRYYRRSLGAAMDNDALMFSLGLVFVEDGGVTWNAVARRTDLNRDGLGINTVSSDAATVYSGYLSNRRPMWNGNLIFAIGGQVGNARLMGNNQDVNVSAQYDIAW